MNIFNLIKSRLCIASLSIIFVVACSKPETTSRFEESTNTTKSFKTDFDDNQNLKGLNDDLNEITSDPEPPKFHIYFADWSEWGRTSKDCKKFGLCDFVDCWACCEQGGVIVDCPTAERIPNSGTITIDLQTNIGYLVIELDPLYSDQADAILNQKTLYVDEDIVKSNAILHSGEYLFDPTIGEYGGYSLDVTRIE